MCAQTGDGRIRYDAFPRKIEVVDQDSFGMVGDKFLYQVATPGGNEPQCLN